MSLLPPEQYKRIVGFPYSEVIIGTDSKDVIYADSGDDTIYGRAGDDELWGDQGNDVIYGDGGDDFVKDDDGSNTIYGGAGNDRIESLNGSGVIFGEDGDDRIFSYSRMSGGAGNDYLDAGIREDHYRGDIALNDQVSGDDGDDEIYGSGTLDGGMGNDTIFGSGVLIGGLGADIIAVEETSFTNYIWGGNIVSNGDDGGDTVTGGRGVDIIVVGPNSIVEAGSDNDIITAHNGGHIIDGGDDNDTITLTGSGISRVMATSGFDQISVVFMDLQSRAIIDFGDTQSHETLAFSYVPDKADLIVQSGIASVQLGYYVDNAHFYREAFGGIAQDMVVTHTETDTSLSHQNNVSIRALQSTIDTITTGVGHDTIWAFNGADAISTQSGKDHIYAGGGADIITGGADNDFIYGDDGFDTAVLSGMNGGYKLAITALKASISDTNFHDGDDGYDFMYGVERLKFQNGTLDLADRHFTGTAAGDLIKATDNAGWLIEGKNGNDTLQGRSGHDLLFGQEGDDRIFGYAGDDLLAGGAGFDTLYGGAGAVIFQFDISAFSSRDIVRDFSLAEGDTLRFVDLLDGYDAIHDAVSDFIKITDNGSHSYVYVDRDGKEADAFGFQQVCALRFVTGLPDLDVLVQAHSIDITQGNT